MGINLVDHIIVSETKYYSFREEKLFDTMPLSEIPFENEVTFKAVI